VGEGGECEEPDGCKYVVATRPSNIKPGPAWPWLKMPQDETRSGTDHVPGPHAQSAKEVEARQKPEELWGNLLKHSRAFLPWATGRPTLTTTSGRLDGTPWQLLIAWPERVSHSSICRHRVSCRAHDAVALAGAYIALPSADRRPGQSHLHLLLCRLPPALTQSRSPPTDCDD
jgi:hypothetical protein